jgi:hypothetical protein
MFDWPARTKILSGFLCAKALVGKKHKVRATNVRNGKGLMVNRAEVMDVAAIMAIYERLLVVMGI